MYTYTHKYLYEIIRDYCVVESLIIKLNNYSNPWVDCGKI